MILDVSGEGSSEEEALWMPEVSAEMHEELFGLAYMVREMELWKEVSDQDWYGVQDPETGEIQIVSGLGMEELPELVTTLEEVVERGFRKIHYCYDFGDNWEHRIQIEDVIDPKVLNPMPELLKGRGACPPEDCGGIWGYQALLAGEPQFADCWDPAHVKEIQNAKFDPKEVEFSPARETYERWVEGWRLSGSTPRRRDATGTACGRMPQPRSTVPRPVPGRRGRAGGSGPRGRTGPWRTLVCESVSTRAARRSFRGGSGSPWRGR
jgi:hypothetical protein